MKNDTVGSHVELERLLRHRDGDWWARICGKLPEVAALEGVVQPHQYHPEGDAATHTRLTVEACPPDAEADLLWAALLHDVGKAQTTTSEQGVIRSHGHAREGEAIVRAVLERLGMAPQRIERIAWLVRHHHFHFSWGLTSLEQVSPRQRRFVADERFGLLLELLRADSLGSHGYRRKLEAYSFYRELKQRVDEQDGATGGRDGGRGETPG